MQVPHGVIGSDDPEVLLVEDEEPLAALYKQWLTSDFSVTTTYTCEDAIERLSESIDVVILDRRLPDRSGKHVLDHIQSERLDCMVTIVSAVQPDFDIANFPIDDYLVKPISQEVLLNTVNELLFRSTVNLTKQELLALLSRKIVLENENMPEELAQADEYQGLIQKIEILESELDTSPQEISSRHRPDSCPECELRWNINIDGTVGFVVMAARVWKCIECGRVVHKPASSNRSVTRGQ